MKVSPYLERPLRSLDKAVAEVARPVALQAVCEVPSEDRPATSAVEGAASRTATETFKDNSRSNKTPI